MRDGEWIPLIGGEIEVTWRGMPLNPRSYSCTEDLLSELRAAAEAYRTRHIPDVEDGAVVASGGLCAPLSPTYDLHHLGFSEPTPGAMSEDAVPYDRRPDDCWRCDARGAASVVGLCAPCMEALTDA